MKKLIIISIVALFMAANCFGDNIISINACPAVFDNVPNTTTLEYFLPERPAVLGFTFEVSPDQIDPAKIENKTEVIKYFLEHGDVCGVVGHQWESFVYPYATLQACMDNNWNIVPCSEASSRQCTLCGKTQRENTVIKWDDIK